MSKLKKSQLSCVILLLAVICIENSYEIKTIFSPLQIYNQWIQNSNVMTCNNNQNDEVCIEISKSDIKTQFGVRSKIDLKNSTTILQIPSNQMIDPYLLLSSFQNYQKIHLTLPISQQITNFANTLEESSIEKLLWLELSKTLQFSTESHYHSKEMEKKKSESRDRTLLQIFEKIPAHSVSPLAVLLIRLIHFSTSTSYFYPWISSSFLSIYLIYLIYLLI